MILGDLLQLLFSLLALLPFHRNPYSLPENVVDVGYTRYTSSNRLGDYSIAYLGVSYAEPPIGVRRFRSPLPLNEINEKWNEKNLVDVSSYPNSCIQGGRDGLLGGAGSEDCLKVNIYKPINATRDSALPVLVFFHGGGYIFGNPRNFPFDHWINQSPNIVIVSVYYRVGAFGFLTPPRSNLGPNSTSSFDLNAGFLDQLEALRWIQRNIKSFGGDPARVTIDGHSAGGSSVLLHLVREEAQNERLFSAAIAQSVYRVPVPKVDQQEALFEFFAFQAGCGGGDLPTQMDCLKDADVSILARAQDLAVLSTVFTSPYRYFRPVVDGKVISDYPTRLLLKGEFMQVPLLIGATSNETSIPEGDVEEGLRLLYPSLSDDDIAEFLEVYPRERFDSIPQQFRSTTGESVFICARSLMARAFNKASSDVWAYRYDQPNPVLRSPVVAHSAESWMMFNGTKTGNNGTATFTPLDDTELAFSKELIAYWISFVRGHDPNEFKLNGSPEWPMYSSSEKYMQIVLHQGAKESGSYVESEDEEERRRCDFVAGKVDREQN
ncbi:alpha/beta-hydrolase [Marasmius fiardii PR-910]|nr:alpha/beta-hydrolase [Marasmius fiardii PR-910]